MTPAERTQVLAALLDRARQHRPGQSPAMPRISYCPTSWMTERHALGSSNEVIAFNWDHLGLEAQLGVWLVASDEDYEFVRDRTNVMKGSQP